MSRNMWILAALFAVLAIAMMYQESSGGIDRPWAECKESLVQQMFSSQCTPRTGGIRGSSTGEIAPRETAPAPAPDLPVGEIRRD